MQIVVYGIIKNDGAGGAFISWFITNEEAVLAEENEDEQFGESTVFKVETYIGSNIHLEALDAFHDSMDELEALCHK